jgi:hypothetical protein
MEWSVQLTDEFNAWLNGLELDEQEEVVSVIDLLGQRGPQLGFPYSSKVFGSRHGHIRELRIQCRGRPYRVLYAFEPRRVAILLLGGDKTGDRRWYERAIPLADRLYDRHLEDLRKEGLN